MKLLTVLICIGTILVTIITSNTTNSEQLSATFVLDTSDSDSPSPAAVLQSDNQETSGSVPKATLRSLELDRNTRIITDDSTSNSSENNNNKQTSTRLNQTTGGQQRGPTNQNQNHQSAVHNSDQQTTTTTRKPNQSHTHTHNNNSQITPAPPPPPPNKRTLQYNDNSTSSSTRRLEEESQLAPAVHRDTNGSGSGSSQQHNHNQQKTTTTTTSSPYSDSDTPKTEERLLISITSGGDDDGPYQKPQKAGGNYGDDTSLQVPTTSSSSQQVHHHNKRKPSITISIQDANINKQNGVGGGGSSPSAVIVRPGEDGQSIVIATVGSSSVGNNKYNNKPGESINIPLGGNHNQQQQQPYREPINNPIQSIINQHQITSTSTRRPPPLSDDYNNNRPITSTLVDQQRPQVLTDERPQRPSNLDENSSSGYETPRPNNSHRPITSSGSSTSEPPYSGSSYNDNHNQNGGLSPSVSTTNNNNNNYDQQQNNNQNNDQYGTNEQLKFPLNEKNCGVMHETRIVGGEEADPDDFMWMTAIIKSKPKDGEPRPFCGGSLITRRHILTAAHCLEGLAPRDVLIRLGSYDFDDSTASSSSADYAIDQFRVPAQYSKKTHVADIAIMRLKTPLSSSDNYKTVCMPQPRRSYVGALGTVTGYGSQSQTFRRAAPKLRQVTVPIWENRKCSVVYKKNLTDSFMCAGYEEGGKDACQGDSGGPLMTEGPDQKMMIVGVVSHGIGCGSPGYPGVYTRTTTFTDWIEKNTRE